MPHPDQLDDCSWKREILEGRKPRQSQKPQPQEDEKANEETSRGDQASRADAGVGQHQPQVQGDDEENGGHDGG